MKNPKELIIEEYKKRGVPISLEHFYALYKDQLTQANETLSGITPLNNMQGLSPEQAYELVEFYGEGFLFSSEIEKHIHEYAETRRKLDTIEEKRNPQSDK